MSETEPTTSEDAPQTAPEAAPSDTPSPSFDFSDLRGFQRLEAAAPDDPEAYARELAKELVVRADRFVQSVDDSIVLASDGVVRWLGDPVGRLVAGEELLKPRIMLLADEALPEVSHEAVQNRLALWITAHLKKVLGPLESLVTAEGLGDGAKDVAAKVVEALGVLDREKIRAQVKGLDQNARAALRKLGVRFGAHYIFLPTLLKPGARTLCTQLFALKHGVEAGAEKLLAYAAAGRTSFAAEGQLSPDSYRVAGFRLCGERVVRIDIVERLTDLIRAAIPDQMRPGSAPASEAAGFLVTQQMTSLTGCAGEAFASILRSLGYESHQVKKSEYEAAMRKPEPAAMAPVAPAPVVEEGPAEVEGASVEPQAGVAESETRETEAQEAEAQENVAVETEAQVSETLETEGVANSEAEAAAPVEAAQEPVADEPVAAEPAALEPATEAAPAQEPAAEETTGEPAETGESAAESEEPTETETAAQAEIEAGADDATPEAAAEPEAEIFVEVWRPAPRQRRPHHQHHHHRRQAASEGTGRIVWRAKEPTATPEGRGGGRRGPQPEATPVTETAGEPSTLPEAGRDEGSRRRDERWQTPPKGPRRDDRRNDRGPNAPVDNAPRKEQRPSRPVDPDSPFAKLLALKPLLEKQDRKK